MDPLDRKTEMENLDRKEADALLPKDKRVGIDIVLSEQNVVDPNTEKRDLQENHSLKRSSKAMEESSAKSLVNDEIEGNDWKRYCKMMGVDDSVRSSESPLSLIFRKPSVSDDLEGEREAGVQTHFISDSTKKYLKHCEEVDANPELGLYKLTSEEFMCQTEAHESEFGPSENLETIRDECFDQAWPWEDRMKMYKLTHNRYIEVQRMKKMKTQDGDSSKSLLPEQTKQTGNILHGESLHYKFS